MGVRRDKGVALVRYLTGSTGIPLLSWDGEGIAAPAPYEISVTTNRKLANWHELMRDLPADKPHMAIRYDNLLPNVSYAWVGMTLGGFAPLLQAHYNTIADRIKGE